MFSRNRPGGALRALALSLIFVLASATSSLAQAGAGALSGTVTAANQPVAGAAVTATGSNHTFRA